MRRPANSRRGQAAVEFPALILLVAALAATSAGLVRQSDLVNRIGAQLIGQATPAPAALSVLPASLAGQPGGLTLSGARAWLTEDVGEAAARLQVNSMITADARQRHAAWFEPLAVPSVVGRTQHGAIIASPYGATLVRLVTPAEEETIAAEAHSTRERLVAAVTQLAWSGAASLARRIARPLGLVVSAAQLVTSATSSDDPVPPGARADDIVLCRPVVIARQSRTAQQMTPIGRAWRLGIIRRGRLVLDALIDSPVPCGRAAAG